VPEGGLRPGKLPPQLLTRLLANLRFDDRVVVRPAVGVDAAVIDFRPSNLVAKTDPITFASDLIGWYAVQVNSNDIAASGGTPRWFLATVLLPEGCEEALPEKIFEQIRAAASEIGVSLVGGHTEITPAVDRPIVCGTMLGEVAPGAHLSSAGARPGDRLILTKGIAIEGTAVLAREQPDRLKAAGLSRGKIERAAGYLFDPGIGVLADARAALAAGEVHALHDPTEGGLATALFELGSASGCGVRVDVSAIEVLPECEEISRALGIDPWGLLASGALLIAAPPTSAAVVVSALRAARIPASDIGELTGRPDQFERTLAGTSNPLPRFERDELTRVL